MENINTGNGAYKIKAAIQNNPKASLIPFL